MKIGILGAALDEINAIKSQLHITDETVIANIESDIHKNMLAEFSIAKPTVYTGVIASGDKFVADALQNDAFILADHTVLAVEMEGAAVAQVCAEHGTPYVIIRTISDRADHQAHIDFPLFIKEIASHYSLGIVKRLIDLISL